MPPALFFFLNCFDYLGVLWFHTNFSIICCISMKNGVGILIDCFESVCCLEYGHVILIHPVHKHGISFHFFVSSSTSFIVILVLV